MNALQTAISMAETPGAFAAGIGVTASTPYMWLSRRGVAPIEHRPAIERFLKGAMTCEQLSTDGAVWVRVPDPAWPWHAAGRPAWDITKSRIHKNGRKAKKLK